MYYIYIIIIPNFFHFLFHDGILSNVLKVYN